MFVIINQKILYDRRLSAFEKTLLMAVIQDSYGDTYKINMPKLTTDLAYEDKEPLEPKLWELLDKISLMGYFEITEDKKEILLDLEYLMVFEASEVVKPKQTPKPTKKSVQVSPEAYEVRDYLQMSKYLRQLSKRQATSSKKDAEHIQARLNDGATKEECIAVVNWCIDKYPYFKENPQYIRASTMFNRTKFNDYLSQALEIEGIKEMVITDTSLYHAETEEEVCQI